MRALAIVMTIACFSWTVASADAVVLSASRTGPTSVALSWSGGTTLYQVYSSGTPSGVASPGNLIAQTSATSQTDSAATGPLLFYQVTDGHCVDASTCPPAAETCLAATCTAGDCGFGPAEDDGIACTIDTCDSITGEVFHEWVCPSGRLPDSASQFCIDDIGAAPCPAAPFGQDGDYLLDVPSYVVSAAGIVSDPVTGLSWERDVANPLGQDRFGADAYCEGLSLDGFNDWRVPTRYELITLLDAQSALPPFDPTVFLLIPSNQTFRTTTSVAFVGANTWGVSTDYAVLVPVSDGDAALVRCVRTSVAGSGGAPVIAGPEVIYDPRTNLSWQTHVLGPSTWVDALDACEASTVGGYLDWRLPNQKELASIVDEDRFAPAISPLFIDRPLETFWTSSPNPAAPDTAYAIDFATGANAGISNITSSSFYVRCVR